MHAIQLDNLRKEYGNGRGIHGLTLDVDRGEIFGFLGPNGAGKSTTLRTLLGLLTPDSGCGSVLGHDIMGASQAVRAVTGYLPSENTLYANLSGEDNLRLALAIRGCRAGMDRARSLAERLDVDLRCTLRSLSHGQRQKVAIVVALAHDPAVLILDEPSSGLDPLVQSIFFDLLRDERDSGKAVFMSSHVLPEVEALCSRVGIVRDGDLVEVDSVDALRRHRVKHVSAAFGGDVPNLSAWPGVSEIRMERSQVQFSYRGAMPPLLELLAAERIVDVTVNDPSLEEVFRSYYHGPDAAPCMKGDEPE